MNSCIVFDKFFEVLLCLEGGGRGLFFFPILNQEFEAWGTNINAFRLSKSCYQRLLLSFLFSILSYQSLPYRSANERKEIVFHKVKVTNPCQQPMTAGSHMSHIHHNCQDHPSATFCNFHLCIKFIQEKYMKSHSW